MKKNSSSSKGVQVLTQHIGISASKARRIIDQIRGRSYEETLTILKFMPYQASSLIFRLVFSASSCFCLIYDSLIRFFRLCSYSDLYNYNLPFVIKKEDS